jgi:hypothetical protein
MVTGTCTLIIAILLGVLNPLAGLAGGLFTLLVFVCLLAGLGDIEERRR